MRKKSVSKTVKKPSTKTVRGRAVKSKPTPKKTRTTTPRAISRYVVQVDTVKGVGYLSAWDRKGGPQFDTDVTKALVGGDSNLMWHFAAAVAERKPRGVRSVDVVPMGVVKKN